MPPPTSIPRFLLPQGSTLWRLPKPSALTHPTIRHYVSKKSASSFLKKASRAPPPSPSPLTKAPLKPLVLEKPTKFNPPSHGTRLRKEAPRYPGPMLSEEEKARQATKKYPNMMPSEGTFMGWFVRSRSIHLYISLTTLCTLAAFVWSTNFKRTSPYSDMLPTWGSLLSHPIVSTRQFFDVLKMTQDHIGAETAEKRRRKVEDVAKRSAYRKAHGLDKDEGFGGWTAKSDDQLLGPGIPIGDMNAVAGPGVVVATEGGASEVEEEQVPVKRERRPIKKWLGIW